MSVEHDVVVLPESGVIAGVGPGTGWTATTSTGTIAVTLAGSEEPVRHRRLVAAPWRSVLGAFAVAAALPFIDAYDPAAARRRSAETMSVYVRGGGDLFFDELEYSHVLPSVVSAPQHRSGLFFPRGWTLPFLGPRRPSPRLLAGADPDE